MVTAPEIAVPVKTQGARSWAQHGPVWIFERLQADPDGKLAPWIETRDLTSLDKRQRAKTLFRRIFVACKMRDLNESGL